MYHGHEPQAIEDYAWRDVEAFLIMLPHLNRRFGGPF